MQVSQATPTQVKGTDNPVKLNMSFPTGKLLLKLKLKVNEH